MAASEPSRWQRGDLSAGVARLGSSCRSVARWRGLAVMAPRRLCVRVGMRAAVLQSQPCVRAGIRVAEGRWRSGRCRGPTPFVRVDRLRRLILRHHSPALLPQPYWGWRTLESRDDGRMTVRRTQASDAPSYTGSCPTGQLKPTSAACPPKPWPDVQKCKTTDNTRGAGAKSQTALMVRVLQCCSVARGDSTHFFSRFRLSTAGSGGRQS